jgi:hypothetical protein
MAIEDEVRAALARRVEGIEFGSRVDPTGQPPRGPIGKRLVIIAFALLLGVASFAFLMPSVLDHNKREPGETVTPSASSTPGGQLHTQEITLSPGIGPLYAAFGSVWVVESEGLARVDVHTGEVEHIGVPGISPPGEPHDFDAYGRRSEGSGITSGAGSVWVAAENAFVQIDPETNRIVRRLNSETGITDVVFDSGQLLYGGMIEGAGEVALLDIESGSHEGRPTGTGAFPLVLATKNWLWSGGEAFGDQPALTRWSRDFTVQQAIDVPAVDSLVEAGGYVWVTGGDELYQVSLDYGGPPTSPQSVFPEKVDAILRTVPIAGPGLLATDGTALWLIDTSDSGGVRLSRLDPATGMIVSGPFELARKWPAELAVVNGQPWLSFRDDGVLVVGRTED